jgi:hypothetical protein
MLCVGEASMTRGFSIRALDLRVGVWRALWLSMVLLHAPAFVSVWWALISSGPLEATVAQGVGLNASMLFFVLKLFDARFLRGRTDWRSCVSYGLIIALVHVGVVIPAAGALAGVEHFPLASLALVAGGPVRIMNSGWRAALAYSGPARPAGLRAVQPSGPAWLVPPQLRRWTLLFRTSIPRSPPA